MMEIQLSFDIIISTIGKLFILMLVGYMLHKMKLINDEFVDKLSLLLIRVIFPALIISKTINHFSFSGYTYWWVLSLCAIGFCLGGVAIGWIVLKFLKNFNSKKEFLHLIFDQV